MEYIVSGQISNELEVIVQANTGSYVGFGWKPSSEQLRVDAFTFRQSLLSAQCISSIGQIIKSVYVSVSESVSHTKRVERSTDRNLPPIFTKLATKVESQEMWLPIVFGGNPKHFYPLNRKWN